MIPSLENGSIRIVDNKIEVQNLLFGIIEANNTFNFEQLMAYDALIVEGSDANYVRFFVKSIRSHRNPEFYLKPVFVLNPRITRDPIVSRMTDGVVLSLEQLNDLAGDVKEIFLKTTQLDPAVPASFEGKMMKKVFDYLFTRNRSALEPLLDKRSSIGYTWPELSVNFESHEEHKGLQLLEWATKEELFTAEFVDRAYLCGSCSNGFMLYREVCQGCSSPNISVFDNIHHFPCAYVGPVKDFKSNADGSMTCPKCSKKLRHIGVDYDKPSSISHCNNCDADFQDVYVKAKCLSCACDVEVQFLNPQNINTYRFTNKSTLVDAIKILTSQQIEVKGAIRFEAFKMMIHYQIERVKNNPQVQTHHVCFKFKNADKLYNVIGNNGTLNVMSDAVGMMHEFISSADFIAVENKYAVHVCINDLHESRVAQMMSDISKKVSQMVKDNLAGFVLEIESVCTKIMPHTVTNNLFSIPEAENVS